MNPDLTRQIAERLSKLHDAQVSVAPMDTVLQITSETQGDLVTLSSLGRPVMEMSSMHRGAIRGEMLVHMASGGPKSAFNLQVGDAVQTAEVPLNPHGYTSFADSALTTTGLAHLHHTTLGVPEGDRSGHVTLQLSTENEVVPAVGGEVPSDEVDEEFWKAFGMNGPEDMTPDKLAEVTKKLQEFGLNLKRMQREQPSTMGVAVRVKHRTPKKRKRRK